MQSPEFENLPALPLEDIKHMYVAAQGERKINLRDDIQRQMFEIGLLACSVPIEDRREMLDRFSEAEKDYEDEV